MAGGLSPLRQAIDWSGLFYGMYAQIWQTHFAVLPERVQTVGPGVTM